MRRHGQLGAIAAAVLVACGESYDAAPCDPANGPCEAPLPGRGCSTDAECGHGTCRSGMCACEGGYGGEQCAACADGFQDNDHDGTCLPACGAMKCGAHEQCDDGAGTAACACVVGYTKGAAGCTWSGGPRDPELQKTDVWKSENGGFVEPAASVPGMLDPGYATLFDPDCKQPAPPAVSQGFDMPAYADAEPLALVVSIADSGKGGPGGPPGRDRTIDASFNGGDIIGRFGDVFGEQRICLGERWYGTHVDLRFAEGYGGACRTTPNDPMHQAPRVDHAGIAPASECPALGTVTNADFEGQSGWKVSSAEIGPGLGANGTRGARLTATGCSTPSIEGTFSAPWKTMKRPALRFVQNGTSNAALRLTVPSSTASFTFGSVRGTGASGEVRVCLPSWARGYAGAFTAYLEYRADDGCSTWPARSQTLDDFSFVSDPSCPEDDAPILDGGFEQANPTPWNLTLSTARSAASINASSNAHSGQGYLELDSLVQCVSASALQYVLAPAAKPGEGPALRFWYRTSGTGTMTAIPGGTLPATSTWTQKTVCLDAARAGHVQAIGFEAYMPPPCNEAAANTRLYVDDVEVVTDPMCPPK